MRPHSRRWAGISLPRRVRPDNVVSLVRQLDLRYIPLNITKTVMRSTMKIHGSRLTTCCVTSDGKTICLDLLDSSGDPISLHLPFDQARALTMTLPRLLTAALKARTGNDTARHVFSLGSWRLEAATDLQLIITLSTTDGFAVSFCAQSQDCYQLARALGAHAEWAPDGARILVN